MYAAVTMNLLKKLASVTEDAAPPPIQVKLPDFSQVQFPEQDMSYKDKRSFIEKMAIQFAATITTESAHKSTPHVSYKDIDVQPANDIKLIDVLIKDDVDSFLTGLFQLLPSSC